jgi:hypothetical protein
LYSSVSLPSLYPTLLVSLLFFNMSKTASLSACLATCLLAFRETSRKSNRFLLLTALVMGFFDPCRSSFVAYLYLYGLLCPRPLACDLLMLSFLGKISVIT